MQLQVDRQAGRQMKQWAKESRFHFIFNLTSLFLFDWLLTLFSLLLFRFFLFFCMLKFSAITVATGAWQKCKSETQKERERERRTAIAFSIFSNTPARNTYTSLSHLNPSPLSFSLPLCPLSARHSFVSFCTCNGIIIFYCCPRRLSRFLCSTSINF